MPSANDVSLWRPDNGHPAARAHRLFPTHSRALGHFPTAWRPFVHHVARYSVPARGSTPTTPCEGRPLG
jgi:hypothetical protein